MLSNDTPLRLMKLREPVSMEGERHVVWQIGNVDLLEGLTVQQHDIGLLPHPIKHQGDQDTVILSNTKGIGDEVHFTRVVTLFEPGAVVVEVFQVLLDEGLPPVVHLNPAICVSIL